MSEYDIVTNTQPYAEDLGLDMPVDPLLSPPSASGTMPVRRADMKVTTATIGTLASTPVVAWFAAAIQAQPGAETTSNIIHGLSSLGFAGLVWWLLAVRDPRREAAAIENQVAHDKRIDQLYREHAKQLREVVDIVSALRASVESQRTQE